MAIKTISQLENGKNDLFYTDSGANGLGKNAQNKTKNTFIEVSIPKDNNENPTSFTSKKLKLVDLSTLIEYSLYNETNVLSGDKLFLNNVTANQNLEVNGNFHVNKTMKNDTAVVIQASNMFLNSQNETNIEGGSRVIIQTQTTTQGNNSLLQLKELNNINLNTGGNLIEESKHHEIQYKDGFVIGWKRQDGVFVEMISCYQDQIVFTPNAKVKVLGNDLTCTATTAKWN